MKKELSIFKFQIFSAIFTMILGTLLHFTFEWSNNNSFVAFFSAVNESVWEHLKLVFFPMLLTTFIGYFYFKDTIPNYLCSKTFGIIIAILFIILFFYTYTGILGKNIAILDISSFFISVILGEYSAYKKMNSNSSCNNIIPLIILILLLFLFILFTYFPIQIGLFQDPITSTFGISKFFNRFY